MEGGWTITTGVICALALAVGACGGDGATDVPPSPVAERELPRWSAERLKNRDGSPYAPSVTGMLIGKDGTRIRNWGEPGVRRRVVANFAAIQDNFRAGDLRAACRYVYDASFGSVGWCPGELRRLAGTLHRRMGPPGNLRVLWVRAYPGVAGLWVESPRGQRLRIQFRPDGGDWRLELGLLHEKETLAMRLSNRSAVG